MDLRRPQLDYYFRKNVTFFSSSVIAFSKLKYSYMHSKVLFLEFIYYHYQNREKKQN